MIGQFANPQSSEIRGHKVRTLMKWNPGETNTLSSLVYILKENQPQLWMQLSLDFVNLHQLYNSNEVLLISVQPTLSHQDHAQSWGNAISAHLGCEHIVGLRKFNPTAQKDKTKFERTDLELISIVDISAFTSKKIIFVDDIVTTGSTLKAAYEALGRPRDFECWSMAYRTVGSIAK